MIFLNRMDADIITIASHYGYENQSKQLIEEMAELIQAINKFDRAGYTGGGDIFSLPTDAPEYQNMVEEIADVQLMLFQMEFLLDCQRSVDEIEQQKATRQVYRIWQEMEAPDNDG